VQNRVGADLDSRFDDGTLRIQDGDTGLGQAGQMIRHHPAVNPGQLESVVDPVRLERVLQLHQLDRVSAARCQTEGVRQVDLALGIVRANLIEALKDLGCG
jgi:hypothetical protein